MPSFAARVTAVGEGIGEAPWPDQEYVREWGLFGLPFDSGHVLALRVFPRNSFARPECGSHPVPLLRRPFRDV